MTEARKAFSFSEIAFGAPKQSAMVVKIGVGNAPPFQVPVIDTYEKYVEHFGPDESWRGYFTQPPKIALRVSTAVPEDEVWLTDGKNGVRAKLPRSKP